MDAVVEDVDCSCAKTSNVTSSQRPFRSQAGCSLQTILGYLILGHFYLICMPNVFFRGHTHHCVYMYSFQPMFYYLIDWHRLSISFIDPFTIPIYHCNLDKIFIQDANSRSQNNFFFFKRHCIDRITNFIFFSFLQSLG